MAEEKDRQGAGKWSGARPHEEFLEFCAISTTGELTAEEHEELQAHLAVCAECRQALKEFETVADLAVPLLARDLSAPGAWEQNSAPGDLGEAGVAPVSVAAGKALPASGPIEPGKRGNFALRDGHRPAQVNWTYVWLPFAAAVLLTAALGIYSYRVGRHTSLEAGQAGSNSQAAKLDTKVDSLERRMSDLGHERELLETRLTERDQTIAQLRREIESESAALAEMKSAQASLEASLRNNQAEKQEVAQQRSDLTQELNVAEASLQKSKAELDFIQRQRALDQLRASDLNGQISRLYGELQDRQKTIAKQQQMLSYDRDIRDLIAARNLYIAEVYDVARDGATRKPFGRIFYTKGKSLIFYAYDLDQQPGVKQASTFQAWGQRDSDTRQALNLGLFYRDNVSGKRWVLKVDNPRALAQIDAVFVTVEPNGGSPRPSGKRLLYAYLRVQPNHP